MDLGLSRITRLVRDHHKLLPWKAVHVAGTNGKGTTSRYLEALLERGNIKVGLFSSPHLVDRHDCIRVGGRPVPRQTFLECEDLVKQRDHRDNINATSFELLTATAYEVFVRARTEVALIECGLGGRLDATNILLPEEVLCSVITRIGLDHQDVLGDTVEEIAAEKAGIIKRGVPVVVDPTNLLSVKSVLKRRAEDLQSTFHCARFTDSKDYLVNNSSLAESAYHVVIDSLRKHPGRSKRIIRLPDPVIHETMQVTAQHFDGRFQQVDVRAITRAAKDVILDGAHNEQAATALRQKVDCLHSSPTAVTWVIAMSSTKNSEAFLKALIRPDDKAIFCEFGPVEGMPWVKPQMKEVLRTLASDITEDTRVVPSPEEALKTAAEITLATSDIIVSGSLYLIGDVLRLLRTANSRPKIKKVRLPQRSEEGETTFDVSDEPPSPTHDQHRRRAKQGLCRYCGSAGHQIKDCAKLQNKKARKGDLRGNTPDAQKADFKPS